MTPSASDLGPRSVTDRPTFSPAIERRHRRIDPGEWASIHVVGDVHGCAGELRALLDRLAVTEDDLVVFVGDLVRKGPDSAAVIDLVRERPNLLSVRGNNEQKILDGTADEAFESTVVDTLASFPVAISIGDSLVVHGGLDPRKPFGEQAVTDLLETRSLSPVGGYEPPYWFEEYRGPPRVFFGHTVLEEPHAGRWSVGLDTGCVYGGELTAYDWRNETFTSVSAFEAYRSRSEDSIVTPTRPASSTPGELGG